MDYSVLLQWVLTIVGGGGIGSVITYLITINSKKRLLQEEVKQSESKTKSTENDRFEVMYKQITEMTEDYNTLSDQFRKYRVEALDIEQEFINKVREKCAELAELKAKVNYLKGLRCYNFSCPNRIKTNPDKGKED